MSGSGEARPACPTCNGTGMVYFEWGGKAGTSEPCKCVSDPASPPTPEPPPTPCANGAHPKSTKDGPYRWKCLTCGEVWYGPNY